MHFKREKLEKFRSFNGPLIDVRSPSEYYKGHMPNSINIPLFDNDEREIVGKIYKIEGREKAVIKGLQFFEKKLDLFLDNLFSNIYINKPIPKNINDELTIRIYCSRGGMRSQSIAWLLEKYKLNSISLKGGYKTYRRWILDSFSKKWNIIIIGGKTGTGKTRLLSLLEKKKYQTIDLEGFACHRGSTFGGLGMKEQPSNEQFENKISEKLSTFKSNKNIFVEAESANIGKCKIPHEFFNQMKTSRRIEIIRSELNRLDELIETYSQFKKSELKESVLRIKKRLGPQRTKKALDGINDEKWELVCRCVLDYYDRCYEFEKVGKENIKTLDLTDMKYDEKILKLINYFL
ncbi:MULTISPECIES: tRNA 2-selenouridine(34) synthase MnmH [Prochlorococcus]|uniref:Selenophosphate-dependent tRNA 2-selenouridine synthase n=1 Tax=Prochlorococcus marinus str. MIT 9116 TaxID=167544 RepID=A0A0A1ZQ47_PROMR|nr:tRNA 2-selenouridine(34) synthase MnmH [Prochlorococcus marinus]KGF89612.1 Selenophosphate-dependent tRNA 2-selenouridine synthase [Prochlorococcus marinus str. MIT 9107]KGF90379.1 Selenophosphate-dependent tRNA 2-selenouridine synthase [Prochlorococcus marinus str. MIT 9116]KGF92858.1 Selenophosphate-dependent tRNA 2-selenouridine synthase [Prochlorococcus marinus str. MIT 9123]